MKEPSDTDGNNECSIEDKGQVYDHHNFASMDNTKHTPENGSLLISYPNDHLDNHASQAKKAHVKCLPWTCPYVIRWTKMMKTKPNRPNVCSLSLLQDPSVMIFLKTLHVKLHHMTLF